MSLVQIGQRPYEHGICGEAGREPQGTAHRVRVIIFRVVATLAGLFIVVAVVLMASAPWVLLQPDQDVRTELNRWFLTVAGSVDAITAGVLLALAHQPPNTVGQASRLNRLAPCCSDDRHDGDGPARLQPAQTYTITRLEPASRVSAPKISKSQNVEESFSSV
jgi:hypothetical protein